jgi:hypothetical protein
MNIKDAILEDRSNESIWRIAYYVLENPLELNNLWGLIEQGSSQMQMRASWVLTKVIEKDSSMLGSLFGVVLSTLGSTENSGLKRNLLRSIYYADFYEKDYSILFDLACGILSNPSEPIAVRMFSMRIAYRVVILVPELAQEYLKLLKSVEGSITSPGLRNAYVELISLASK